MSPGIVLPLVLLALLVVVLVLLARRAGVALARTRQVTGFQRQVAGLLGRVDPAVERLIGRVDAVRRHQVPADEIRQLLGETHATLTAELDVATAWQVPQGFGDLAAAATDDLQRAARAVEMIVFGAELTTRGDSRQRELEAQTAIKRGYLNLLHARRSLLDHVAALDARTSALPRGWRASRI